MKRLIVVLAAGTLICGQSELSAVPPEDGGKPKKTGFGPDGPMREKMRERFLENMSPEIRQRFEAAREKALQDPKIQELRKNAERANGEFFKAMREKMMELDPELAEIVKQKAGGGKGAKMDKMDKDGRDHGPAQAPGMGGLSEGDRQKLMAARESAKKDPAVQAAEKKKQDAQSPADRQTASEEYRKAMKEAILKADPSLAPVIEKMAPRPPVRPPGPGGDGESMMMNE